jgi:hypothetical protein
MAWAAAIPALIGAAGQIGGGLLGKKKTPGAAYTPSVQESPLFQQLQLLTQLGLGGQVSPAMLRQGSPIGTLLNSAQSIGLGHKGARSMSRAMDDVLAMISQGSASGLSAAQIAAQIEASPLFAPKGGGGKGSKTKKFHGLSGLLGNVNGVNIGDPFGLFTKKPKWGKELGGDVIRRLAAASGFNSIEELIQGQIDFESDVGERTTRANEVADTTEQGRFDALSKIAGIQSGFVAPSEADILSQSGTIEQALRAQIARERSDSQAAVLEQMNALGINPAARLGRLDEWQAQQNLEAQPNALARALQLMSGQQGLQTNALASLQGSLSGADAGAQNLLALQSGNQLGIGQLASQQALALAQMQQQNNQFLGGGVANAGNLAAQLAFLTQNQAAAPGELGLRNTGYGMTTGATNPNAYNVTRLYGG